jgi:hypothetical protein
MTPVDAGFPQELGPNCRPMKLKKNIVKTRTFFFVINGNKEQLKTTVKNNKLWD